MTNKQLLKIINAINDKCSNLTQQEYDNYCCGDGLYQILEDAINEVLMYQDAIDEFWKGYQSETYDGTPCENKVWYIIIEEYWSAKISSTYLRLYKKHNITKIEALIDEIKDLL